MVGLEKNYLDKDISFVMWKRIFLEVAFKLDARLVPFGTHWKSEL